MMKKNMCALKFVMLALIISSCANPESSHSIPKQIQILGVAGIATKNSTAQGFGANLTWTTDSANIYRVPRSFEELNHQIASGYILFDSTKKNKYSSVLGVQKKWWKFQNGTVEYDQSNGPPEELALATNISCSDSVTMSYKVNYTDWIPMRCGIDFGRISFDSLKIDSLNIDPQIETHWTLVGVNLMKDRRNVIFEGDNLLILKVNRQNQDSLQFTFHILYRIK